MKGIQWFIYLPKEFSFTLQCNYKEDLTESPSVLLAQTLTEVLLNYFFQKNLGAGEGKIGRELQGGESNAQQ